MNTVAIVEDVAEIARSIRIIHRQDCEVLTGDVLDQLAARYDITRNINESNYVLRARLRTAISA